MKINNIVVSYVCLLLVTLIVPLVSLNESCESNLECVRSACCKENKCVINDLCKTDVQKIYIAVGLVGVFFFFYSLIYFICSIRASRQNVKKIKESLKGTSE
jgi:hypothetical protein